MNKNRAVLYLRLSDEDKDKLSKEELSESIKNQEKMLKNYAFNQHFKIVGIYNDEDYSGADKNRPNFNKMIDKCRQGLVDIVLVKSQSRFARDMELIEKYVHNLFHEWNIRFITLIDRIDNTKKETKKTSQLMAMTDQWYLEDTSNNIRQTLKIKRKNGEYTGSFAPYGYLKDNTNKNHLVVDKIASQVVKRIYDEYLKGHGLFKIASNLNNDNILSPLEYKKLNGSKIQIPLLKNYETYEYIKKTGSYKVDVTIKNNQNKILKNLKVYNYLTLDNLNFNNNCDIYIRGYPKDKVKFYYTTKTLAKKNWIKLKENDILPKNTTCLITSINFLDKDFIINYQLEITLKENKKHLIYYFNVLTNNNIYKNIKIRKKYLWSMQTIKKILTNEFYIGNLVQFKTTTVSYKNHTVIHNHQKDWIKALNTHEAIIDKKTWDTVQNRLSKKSRSNKTGFIHPFSGKVFCMDCHQIFFKCGNGYLSCKDKKSNFLNCHNKKFVKIEYLTKYINDKLNDLLNKFYDETILRSLNQKYFNKIKEEKINLLQDELNNLNKKLQDKNTYLIKLYEEHTKGLISDKEFVVLKNNYNDNAKLENRIGNIKKEMTIIKNKKIDISNIYLKYRHIDNLNIELINEFIDKILIGPINLKNNTRKIKIIWNFK